jgi:hypothetical protein
MRQIIFSMATIVLLSATSCQSNSAQNGSAQKEPTRENQLLYEHWVCQQGEHAGVEIVYTRMGDVFSGNYIDPDMQRQSGITIMGMIDKEGNITGVSETIAPFDEIFGKLSGKITGDTFHAEWSPSSTGFDAGSAFRTMDMTLKQRSSDMEKEVANELFLPETPYTSIAYGYSLGEWEQRHIYVGEGANEGETEFFLQITENGMNDIDVTITGTATLNGNTFRYKEKNCDFEVTVCNRFIIVKTISGALDGFQVDGVYPKSSAED